jgi:hypothetical protein
MTGDTGTHVVSHRALSDGCRGKVSVARCTGNTCPVVRRVAKDDVSAGRETVHPLPRDLYVLVGILEHFLNTRFFFRQFGMTEHALANGWDAGSGTGIGANVAIHTVYAELHMGVVGESDRLARETGRGAYNDEAYAAPSGPNKASCPPAEQGCGSSIVMRSWQSKR